MPQPVEELFIAASISASGAVVLVEKHRGAHIVLIRFVLAIVRSDWDVIKKLIDAAIDHYTDEIDIPISDVEEEYLEDREEDEDD